MRVFFKFVRKEFIHIFRDPLTLMLLIGMPIVLVLAFGFALTSEVKQIDVVVATPTHTPFVERLFTHLDESDAVGSVSLITPHKDMDEALRTAAAHVIIVLPSNIDKELLAGTEPTVQLRLDASDPNTSALISAQVQGIIYTTVQEYLEQFGALMAMRMATMRPYQIETFTTLLYNPEMRAPYYFVPGVMGLVLMIICALMTSVSIVREKEFGSMEVLLTSPVNPITILLSKTVPYFTLSIFNVITILLLSRFVLGVPLLGSVSAIFFVSLLFILVSLLLGMLISTITDNQTAAMLISGAGLLLPVAMLSGMFFPIESMPILLQYLARAIPATWYSIALKKLMIQGLGWSSILWESLIMTGMSIVLVILALLNFKKKLE